MTTRTEASAREPSRRSALVRLAVLATSSACLVLVSTGFAAPAPLLAAAQRALDGETPARPNVIFILADDLGWGDLRAFGHPYHETPNLDRLVREGACFRQFYVASPVCSPSRASFLTAQFPARLGMHGHLDSHESNESRGIPNWLDPEVPCLSRLLQQAGYATAHFGKWHLGEGARAPTPGEYGFDSFAGYNSRGLQLEAAAERPEDPRQRKPKNALNMEQPFFRARSTRMIVDETLRFIRKHENEPFYIQAWTLLMHHTLEPTPEQLAPWKELAPRADDPAFGPWMQDYLAQAAHLNRQARVYAASIADLDAEVGRLLEGLAALGVAENTVVVFASDNGPEDFGIRDAGNAGVGSTGALRGRKRSLYEGGVRVPLIVRWPGRVPAGLVDETSVLASVDFLPTVCALAGVPVPASIHCDGEDASDILLGQPRPRRAPLLWEWRFDTLREQYRSPRLAIRDGDWKLLVAPDRSRVELYDIPRDPGERDDVAAKHADVVERLAGRVLAWHETLPPLSPAEPPRQPRPR